MHENLTLSLRRLLDAVLVGTLNVRQVEFTLLGGALVDFLLESALGGDSGDRVADVTGNEVCILPLLLHWRQKC